MIQIMECYIFAEKYCITRERDTGHGWVQRHLWQKTGIDWAGEHRGEPAGLPDVSAPGLGQYISGAILFEETLYQSAVDGKKMVDVLIA